MKNVVIYSRVSTSDQDYTRQTRELEEYANQMKFNLVGKYEEKISGFKKNVDRPKLQELLNEIDKGTIDKVLVWEMSRLGRNVVEVLQTIDVFNEKSISLYIKNYNLETLNDDKNPNPLAMFMIQILSSLAQMEREQIKQRMQSGYRNYRQNGGGVGRIKGKKEDKKVFLDKHSDIVKLLRKKMSVRNISKLTGNSSSATIIKVKKMLNVS